MVKKTTGSFDSIKEFLTFGAEYELVWAFVFNADEDLTSEVLGRLESFEFEDIRSILVTLKVAENPWIGSEIAVPNRLPEVQCFFGGGGIARINKLSDLSNTVAIAKNMVLQMRALQQD